LRIRIVEAILADHLFHLRAAVCNQPWVKGTTQMVNGIYNGSRFEDVWLDK
jgi:peptide/nickel transport system substrate-binding protein